MTNVISELSKYLIIILMILYTFQCFTIFRKHYEEDKRHVLRKQIVLMLFMNFVAYAVLYLQTEDTNMILMYLAVLVFIVLVQILYRVIYRKANMLVVNNMCMLLSIGFLMLSRLQFDRAVKQFAIASAAMLLSLIVPVIVRKVKHLKDLTWLYGIAGLLMLVAVLGLAAVTGGAKLSIEIGDFTFQFSELVKIIFVFFVAGMLREDTSFRQVVITTAVAGAHVVILVLSRDLGSALIFFLVFVFLVFFATGKYRYLALGAAGGCAAACVAYRLFSHVQVRVQAWRDPWSVIDSQGYQITQSLFALSRGGWFGLGIGRGTPEDIPYVETDFIFAAVTEELGLLFSVSLLVACVCCFLQCMRIAMGNAHAQQDRFYRLLASGFGVMYIFQVFLTVGGGIRFIPLTGVTLPLVSYGGSSVMTTLFLFAAVQGAGLKRRAPLPGDDEEDWDEEDDEWQEDEYEEEEVNEWEDEDETSYRGQSHGGKRRSGRKGR